MTDLEDQLDRVYSERNELAVAFAKAALAAFVEDMDVQHPKYIAAAIRARSNT